MGASTPMKSLVVCPVGKAGKEFVRKIVERFGHASFDFLLLVYDDTCFDESCFADCTVVHDERPLFWRLRKHVTPELCRLYEYVFIWMDDLDALPHGLSVDGVDVVDLYRHLGGDRRRSILADEYSKASHCFTGTKHEGAFSIRKIGFLVG